MRTPSYELDDTPLKTVEDTTLLKTDRCIITAFKGTLALPLIFSEKICGFFMHGTGSLVIDTIIETPKGAIGKSTQKNLTEPFIVVGNSEEAKEKMIEADPSSLGVLGYENTETFREKAEEICEQILSGKMKRTHTNGKLTSVFFFLTGDNSYDTLISKNPKKLVYVSDGKVYVFANDKSLVTSPNEVLLSKQGKTIISANNNILIER